MFFKRKDKGKKFSWEEVTKKIENMRKRIDEEIVKVEKIINLLGGTSVLNERLEGIINDILNYNSQLHRLMEELEVILKRVETEALTPSQSKSLLKRVEVIYSTISSILSELNSQANPLKKMLSDLEALETKVFFGVRSLQRDPTLVDATTSFSQFGKEVLKETLKFKPWGVKK